MIYSHKQTSYKKEAPVILGIETSCDETSAAVLRGETLLSNVIASQAVHVQFRGVVPELASRAHLRKIVPIVDEALERAHITLDDVDAVAVTAGPGLVGALLVGVNYAKGLVIAQKKPLVGVHHLEGHIYSNFLSHPELEPPLLVLIVSGGHTMLVGMKDHLHYRTLGSTRDDAVGEAYDKVAKILGLGYPGGPVIDRLAQQGDPNFVTFPKGLEKGTTFDFSYSGLKTAVLNFVRSLDEATLKAHLADVCAAFQKAAIDILVEKTIRAARTFGFKTITVAGGVAANSYLRRALKEQAEQYHLQVFSPAMEFCMDNGAMIARAALERLRQGYVSNLELNAFPTLPLDELSVTYE